MSGVARQMPCQHIFNIPQGLNIKCSCPHCGFLVTVIGDIEQESEAQGPLTGIGDVEKESEAQWPTRDIMFGCISGILFCAAMLCLSLYRRR